jgi:hypothetical protein
MHYETVFIAALWGVLTALPAVAQNDNNVLGLPAVPQNTASGATPGKSAPGLAMNDNDIKGILNGGVTMASSYEGSVAKVLVTTNAKYTKAQHKQVLQAAQLVQRDVAVSCGKLCKPARMPPAKLAATGQAVFDLWIDGLGRVLSSDDMKAMLMGQPLAPNPPASAATAAASSPAQ